MNLGLILTSAVLGGIGILIGQLVSKRFPDKSKTISRVFSVAAVLIAIAVAPIVNRSLFGSDRGDKEPVADRIVRYDRELRDTRLFATIAEGWPARFHAFVNALATASDTEGLAAEFTSDLRRENAAHAVFASDEAMRNYFSASRGAMQIINVESGEAVCAAFMTEGAVALGERQAQVSAHLEQVVVTTMRALRDGRDRRERGEDITPPPSQADLDAFEAFMIDRTGQQGLLEQMRQGTASNLCATGIMVTDGLAEFAPDQPGGRALRAAIFHEIAAG